MPLYDTCQPAVVAALQKEGWTIVKTQAYISKGEFFIYVDLEASKEPEQTYIEIKCFLEGAQDEFYTAVGQYISYRNVIRTQRPGHTLYLAMPERVYDGFTDVEREILAENSVKLIIVDLNSEVIARWIQ